jgi:alanyl-tRNA synthetase
MESEAAVVAIAGQTDGKIVLIIAASQKARDAGISSGKLVKEASAILGGGGGGKDDIAQGGGPNINELAKAFAALEKSLTS